MSPLPTTRGLTTRLGDEMRFKTSVLLIMTGLSLTGCAHGPCNALAGLFGSRCVPKRDQPDFADMRVNLPVFDSRLQVDAKVDGYVLQAIRIAADDFLSPDPANLPCQDQQVSREYQAKREGDIIFVRITFKPENCGMSYGPLDGGITYAINLDGRILRKSSDTAGP
jgi:hypothetical protein